MEETFRGGLPDASILRCVEEVFLFALNDEEDEEFANLETLTLRLVRIVNMELEELGLV